MKMTMTGTLAIGAALLAGAAMAQEYPNGTIEMIVPFSAGGGTDGVARQFAPPFAEALGGNVVIRNVDGASGTIGTTTTAQADPDGYTVGYIPIGPLAIQPVMRPLDYDVDSWDYICQTTDNPVLLMVQTGSDITSMADLQAKGSVIYGSSGPGTIPHLSMAAVSAALGIEGTHVPYDGTGPAMNAMAGGEIEVFGDQPGVVRANDVTPLVILAPERHPEFPDVPTAAEEGFPDLEFSIWQGVVVPKGTPEDIRTKLSDACVAAMESEAFTSAMEKAATGLNYRDAEDFEAFVRRNTDTNTAILRDAGLIE